MTLISLGGRRTARGVAGAALLLAAALVAGAAGEASANSAATPLADTPSPAASATPSASPSEPVSTEPVVTPAEGVTYREPANPVVNAQRFARFSYTDATASKVTLNGSFGPSGATMMVSMSRSGTAWTSLIGPLKPGFYNYVIAADGKDVQDPLNPNHVTSLPIMQTFYVPGATVVPDASTSVPHGDLTILSYYSKVTKTRRKASVWTPPGYRRTNGLPTLYLMHGGGGDHLQWIQLAKANDILDNIFAAHQIKPMAVVFVDGNVPGSIGGPTSDTFPAELIDNVVPAVEKAYRVSTSADDRAMAGLSMGGIQVFNTLATRPGAFAYVGDFSGGYIPAVGAAGSPALELLDNPAINDRTKLLRVYIGNQTDVAYGMNEATRKAFDKYGVRYEFAGVYEPAGHVWETWQVNLVDFAQRIFR